MNPQTGLFPGLAARPALVRGIFAAALCLSSSTAYAACANPDPIAATLCSSSGFANATSSVGTTFGTEFLGVQFPLTGGSSTDPNKTSYGVWTRGFADQNTTKSSVSANGSSVSGSTRTDSQGMQFGFDVGRLTGQGWNLQAGLTGGSLWLKPDTAGNGSLNFDVPFVGGYLTGTNGNFFAQTQLLRGFMHGTISNADANLSNVSSHGNVLSSSGLIGYHYAIDEWSIEPTAGYSWTRLTVQSLALGGLPSAIPAGVITYKPIDSDLGYISVRVAHYFDLQSFAINPYVAASIWNDFNDKGTATFNCALCGSGIGLSSSRVGAYGQFSLGSTATIPGTGFLGFIRADVKAGENIHGWTLTGGMRFTF